MKRSETKQEQPRNIKKKLMSALAMLLIALLLVTTTSYAWFIMAVAPEVTGITTNVGANGSLEVALLNTNTRLDLSTIRTSVGASLANNQTAANYTWGNLVDLSDASYGLGNITLMPTRLNLTEKGGSISGGLLSIPTYGYDGRIVSLTNNTLSAIYGNSIFSYTEGKQDYGVRAIGTTDVLSAQASAMSIAKGNITAFKSSAISSASSALKNNGATMVGILVTHSTNSSAVFTDKDLSALRAMVDDLQKSLNSLEQALRNGLLVIAASELGDETQFNEAKSQIETKDLLLLVNELEDKYPLPEGYSTWVNALYVAQNNLNSASNASVGLVGGSYAWEQIRPILSPLLNPDSENLFIGDYKFSELTPLIAAELMGLPEIELTMGPGSGIFADIAYFTNDYNTEFTYTGKTIVAETKIPQNPVYLDTLYSAVKDLKAASGGGEAKAVELNTLYGYAIDLAFRCNAPASDLLLQTSPEQRVYDDSTSASTMGGGSYMAFTSNDASMSQRQILKLMDGIRVGFLDEMGNVLGIAKLNTSNHVVEGKLFKAPLYLYDYSISTDPETEGAIVMGERQLTSNVITSLEQYTAKAITVLVWLDGDEVDNSMVSATESQSLGGTLNLQFASSANLVPITNGNLMNLTADKSSLKSTVDANKATYEAGQASYTSVSWNEFVNAYDYATAIHGDATATGTQILHSNLKLASAQKGLEKVSTQALNDKITELRKEFGKTSDVAGYVVKDEDGYRFVQADVSQANRVGTIYHIDYTKNLYNEGSNNKTPIYSNESWDQLAQALYEAEFTLQYNPTEEALDDALTALDEAEKSLERAVFFEPYQYKDVLYYKAIPNKHVIEGETDTDKYGKWYSNDFTRIVSDKMILDLDADAKKVDIAQIEMSKYIPVNTNGQITPHIALLDEVYTMLKDEKILATHWELPAQFTKAPGGNTNQTPGSGTQKPVVIPTSSETYEFVYASELEFQGVLPTAGNGTYTFKVWVLTESGIVFTIESDVIVYTPAAGVEMKDDSTTVEAGSTTNLNVLLKNVAADPYGETIKSCTWASTDATIALPAGSGVDGCTVTGMSAGRATVSVSVETEQGNTYTASIEIIVTPAPTTPTEP